MLIILDDNFLGRGYGMIFYAIGSNHTQESLQIIECLDKRIKILIFAQQIKKYAGQITVDQRTF